MTFKNMRVNLFQNRFRLFILAILIFKCAFAHFAGGKGTVKKPFLIKTVEHLNSIRKYPNAYFKLLNDIDFNGTQYDSVNSINNKGWTPVGCDTLSYTDRFYGNTFKGSFNGSGYLIKNLFINRPGNDFVGLFGFIDSCAIIENVNLDSCRVVGKYQVGALAGANKGNIINCSVSGVIINTGKNIGGLVGQNEGSIKECYTRNIVAGNRFAKCVGGLVGLNNGSLIKCYSNGRVFGEGVIGGMTGENDGGIITDCHVQGTIEGKYTTGGLTGENKGTISKCYTDITIRSDGFNTGGLTGIARNSITESHTRGRIINTAGGSSAGGFAGICYGRIFRCYSECNIDSGNDRIGGFIGFNFGSVNQCYSTGNVAAKCMLGGFIGENRGLVTACFSTGNVNGQMSPGGFIGYLFESGKVFMAYSTGKVNCEQNDNGASGFIGHCEKDCNDSIKGFWDQTNAGTSSSFGGTAKSTVEMIHDKIYRDDGWDFDSVWYMNRLINNGYPFLQTFKKVPLSNDMNSRYIPINDTLRRNIEKITASSTLREKYNYIPENITDADPATAWIEGDSGSGEGEWIEILFKKQVNIKSIVIMNGYLKSESTYFENNRIKSCLLQGICGTDTVKREYVFQDLKSHTGIFKPAGEKLEGFKNVTKIRLIIGSVYKGSKYDDTGFSEIIFF